jgi:hypothetical protein
LITTETCYVTSRDERLFRLVVAPLTFAIPVLVGLVAPAVRDPDIWWHLSTGEWILQHRALPYSDPFSVFGAGKPYVAYSWLFDLIASLLYRAFGLMGLLVLEGSLLLAIVYVLHRLLLDVVGAPRASSITIIASIAMEQVFTPRPWLFTILFFLIELYLLEDARRRSDPVRLAWLPLLFAVWANCHIQFVYGLALLAAAVGEQLITRIRGGETPLLRYMAVCAGVSLFATLLNPYHVRLYGVVAEYARERTPFQYIQELKAPDFRNVYSYWMLIMLLGAAFGLGRMRKPDAFHRAVFFAVVWLPFRSVRDLWIAVVMAALVVAHALTRPKGFSPRRMWISLPVAAVVIAGICSLAFSASNAHLNSQLKSNYPVEAADFVRQRHYSGPLYNSFNWGGFLIWRLPELPVSMDGRTNVHGDRRIERSIATLAARESWRTDPELVAAHVVLVERDSALSEALRSEQNRFRLVYEDALATVFLREP